ncbi:helix-turn-helix domain-containing protein [Oscillospiraceae bacterium 50-60]
MPIFLDHEKFSRVIKEKDLKQEPLAEKLDISDRHLRNLCSKNINVSSSLLLKISEALQVPMKDLLTVQEDQEDVK